MPKRSIEATKQVRSFAGPHYSPDDIEKIVAAAGGLPSGEFQPEELGFEVADGQSRRLTRKESLAYHLEIAAQNWKTACYWQTRPTAKQRSDAFDKIEKTAARLETATDKMIDALGLPQQRAEPDPLSPNWKTACYWQTRPTE